MRVGWMLRVGVPAPRGPGRASWTQLEGPDAEQQARSRRWTDLFIATVPYVHPRLPNHPQSLRSSWRSLRCQRRRGSSGASLTTGRACWSSGKQGAGAELWWWGGCGVRERLNLLVLVLKEGELEDRGGCRRARQGEGWPLGVGGRVTAWVAAPVGSQPRVSCSRGCAACLSTPSPLPRCALRDTLCGKCGQKLQAEVQ